MKDEYDFSKGERGKFYRPDAVFEIPVYLEPDILAYLSQRAEAKGMEVTQLINNLLRKDIDLIELMA